MMKAQESSTEEVTTLLGYKVQVKRKGDKFNMKETNYFPYEIVIRYKGAMMNNNLPFEVRVVDCTGDEEKCYFIANVLTKIEALHKAEEFLASSMGKSALQRKENNYV